MARVRTATRFAPVAVVALALALPAPSWALGWHPCRGARGSHCATLRVPLDRTGALAGQVPLRLARLHGSGARPTLV